MREGIIEEVCLKCGASSPVPYEDGWCQRCEDEREEEEEED